MNKPAAAARRRALGWSFIGTANVLKAMLKGTKYEGWNNNQTYLYLGRKEHEHIRAAIKDLRMAEKRIRAVGKHILGKEYGGD